MTGAIPSTSPSPAPTPTAERAPASLMWGTARTIATYIAEVPERWLIGFAAAHPGSTRKFARARNGRMLFFVPDVLAAIEAREGGIA